MDIIKILLVSDLHLGMERINPLISAEERLNTFTRIISLARKHDIILIPGDFINDENIDKKYYTIIRDEFASLIENDVEIYYTPGTSELTSGNRINPDVAGLNTTYTFTDEREEDVCKSSHGDIYIYGQQYNSIKKEWKIGRNEHQGFHIGLFYADFCPQSNGKPVSGVIKKDDIKKMNLDFYALGKNHTFKLFRMANKILGAYPGSAEPCSINENGDRFVVSIELEDNVLKNIKRVAVNTGKILSGEIDCSTLINQNSLFEKIRSSYPEKSIVSLTLTGERDFIIINNFEKELSGYFRNLKILNCSIPTLKIMVEENAGDNTLTGIFFNILNEEIKKDSSIKIQNEIIAEIIFDKNMTGKSGGSVLCDF